jgi:hypothetical protein
MRGVPRQGGAAMIFRSMTMNQSICPVSEEHGLPWAIYSVFFMEGLADCGYDDVLKASGLGCIELVCEVAKFAPYLSRLIDMIQVSSERMEYPGVFEYEVCSPFGIWFGSQVEELSSMPSERACKNWLANVTIQFFTRAGDPKHNWRLVRAVRAVDNDVVFAPSLMQDALNWEWIDRVVPQQLANQYGGEHPDWPRRIWHLAGAGNDREQEYWRWVAYGIEAALLDARYTALAAHRDIFCELARLVPEAAPSCVPNCLRPDLIAQETLGSLPSSTVITPRLLTCRPEFLESLCAMNTSFEQAVWLGRCLSEFLEAYSVAYLPDSTLIVQFSAIGEHSPCKQIVALTLRQLWDAVPIAEGWQLKSGMALRLQKNRVWQNHGSLPHNPGSTGRRR